MIVTPRRGLLFHFTHEDNLPSIIEDGVLLSDTAAQESGRIAVEVGNRGVKALRRRLPVTAGPGGCPADYVPFYFAARSPMLYVISEGRVPEYQDGEDPLVYLVTNIDTVIATGRPFVFSDGNCAKAITDYTTDLNRLDTMVDWPLMNERYWHDTLDDGDRKRRRMAEFLVHEFLPWTAIFGLAVRSEDASHRVASVLGSLGRDLPVRVRPDWYYT